MQEIHRFNHTKNNKSFAKTHATKIRHWNLHTIYSRKSPNKTLTEPMECRILVRPNSEIHRKVTTAEPRRHHIGRKWTWKIRDGGFKPKNLTIFKLQLQCINKTRIKSKKQTKPTTNLGIFHSGQCNTKALVRHWLHGSLMVASDPSSNSRWSWSLATPRHPHWSWPIEPSPWTTRHCPPKVSRGFIWYTMKPF